MNVKERFYETIHFGNPDHITYMFGDPREATLNAWYLQGARDWDRILQRLGQDPRLIIPLDVGPVPRFKERIIEEYDDKQIWIDEFGAKRIDHKEQATPGFVTRAWLDFPVKNRDDFAKMKERFNPKSPERLKVDRELIDKTHDPSSYSQIWINGPFWAVRDWVGFEDLCIMFIDDPAFLDEMFRFITEFMIEALDGRINEMDIDFLGIHEDMAYKTASMVSPAMFEEFIKPRYVEFVDFARSRGIKTICVDCDGHIRELIPHWIDVGIDATYPMEIAAQNDPVHYRDQFGKNLAFIGGIDKRELRKDFAGVKREVMSKVPYLLERGGYIPRVDHGVPPDIPVRNYLYMAELIKAIAEGRNVDDVTINNYDDLLGPIEKEWSPSM